MKRSSVVVVLFRLPAPLFADTPEQVLERYAELAKQDDPAFAGFSIERGPSFT